ncbi:MAG: 16S rRNA (cytidine(1402)-2'-O)-methyltransferase [Gammaproteobacteria bacterium]|nr:16S rRNA (cytidine(1402)-2'-O)-methyltransferase [Gammaproteobacteria bacterium]MDH5653604.1 16S rRNA (cytidine(1402)-2'-O)-methyltransferase [Gammaproteobacteria bacterium]
MSNPAGNLYIVATPIGNLGDLSQRALEILQSVDLIAAEDTRHSQKLLSHFGIKTHCIANHEHNEREMTEKLLQRLRDGASIAVISDAGTPLISDPGYHLVNQAQAHNIRVIPVPGASALLAALAAAGLPTDRFSFEGFLPNKQAARRKVLQQLRSQTATLVFYESPHRILDSLRDMGEVFGREREAVLARELTKTFETIKRDSLENLARWVEQDKDQQRGEIVLVVAGAAPRDPDLIDAETEQTLNVLLNYLPVKQAAAAAAEISGVKKNKLYARAVEMKEGKV